MLRHVRKVSVLGTLFEREFYILKLIKTLLLNSILVILNQ